MFDSVIKFVTDTYPATLVGFFQQQLGLPTGGPVEVVQPNLPQPTIEADRVFRVADPAPMLIHTEWESGSNLGRPDRFLEYNVLLKRYSGLPVQTVVVLLRREAVSRDLTGTLTLARPTGQVYLVFHYEVIRLWELSPEIMLIEPGLTPFAPLCAVAESELPALARRIESAWSTQAEAAVAELLFSTKALMGLRYDIALIDSLFKESGTMRESVYIQKILQEGREEGRLAWTATGRLDEGRDRLLHLGERRFGPVVVASRPQVEAIDDLERLHRMFDKAIDAPDWAAVLATE